MFLAGMRDLERAGGDDIQPEIVTAILQVMFVTDELRRSTAHGACRNRAKRYEGEFDARVPGAVVYYVQLQNPLCKLLLERGKPPALGQHLGRDAQKARRRWRHLDLHFT